MPILAVCPYCGQGKVRAPDNALGLSATCPSCHNCFTLVASSAADVKESARAPAAGRRPTLPAAAVPKPEPSAVVETAVVTRMPTPPPPPVRVADPVSAWTPADTDLPMPGPNVALPVALVALTLAGVGLVVSQAPYGRLGGAALTALGLLLGVGSLLLSERKRLVAAFAAILNGAVLRS